MRPLHVLLLAVAASGCAGSGSAPDADTDTADAPDTDTADAPVASDEDGDGYLVSDGDCAEDDPTVHPGAPEACNGVDDDCDGVVDEDPADAPAWYGDSDGDGYGATTVAIAACDAPSDAFVATDGDCDDGDAAVHPGAEEACTDPTDRNCDGSAGATDADGDGTPACEDCDDADAAVSPGAVEACGGGDEDCDGATDEAGADGELEGYADADGDTFGDPAVALLACTLPEGFVANAEDCDDAAAGVNPGAAEACGGGDEDCDGAVDDADPTLDPATAGLWHVDVDGDTFGAAGPYDRAACVAPAGWIADATDCDDADAGDHPGAEETVGNEEDDDCDGLELCYADADADAYRTDGTVASVDADCADVGEAALGSAAGDCDDADAAVSPGAADTCNGVDDDCDGATDEDVGTEYYVDADEDGYGDSADSTIACSLPSGYAEAGGDCDDDSALASPGGTEACGDGLDNDCDAAFDDCNLAGERLAASADLQVGGPNASDYFGRALATGDFDGDGAPDLFAGMPGADGPGSAAGGTALLYGPISGSGATMAPRLNGPAAASYAGFSVASGDHDGTAPTTSSSAPTASPRTRAPPTSSTAARASSRRTSSRPSWARAGPRSPAAPRSTTSASTWPPAATWTATAPTRSWSAPTSRTPARPPAAPPTCSTARPPAPRAPSPRPRRTPPCAAPLPAGTSARRPPSSTTWTATASTSSCSGPTAPTAAPASRTSSSAAPPRSRAS
jgi:hypothetical protein